MDNSGACGQLAAQDAAAAGVEDEDEDDEDSVLVEDVSLFAGADDEDSLFAAEERLSVR